MDCSFARLDRVSGEAPTDLDRSFQSGFIACAPLPSRWNRYPGYQNERSKCQVSRCKHPGGSVVKDEIVDPAFNEPAHRPLAAQSVFPNRQGTRNPNQRLGGYEQNGAEVQHAPGPAPHPRPAQRRSQVGQRQTRYNEQHDQKMNDYDDVNEHWVLRE
jgi:hypothetical protein